VCFVLFIGFFYTMPQMKGAGTTLAYIFPGLPYWAGVVLVGAVITLNVALGGMKGITLVQAFQYWIKMFAISVPIFVLMAVYGHYGKQLGANGNIQHPTSNIQQSIEGATNLISSPVQNTSPSIQRSPLPEKAPADATWISPFGPLTTKAAKAAGLSAEQSKPYSLLYTYSLIIALVCGTAGLPHILVRFYTNPDGVAAKRTTMWVMILIGVFYVFPPVFGVIGRNLMPELYTGLAGIKGTDQVVLKLPTLLNEKYGVLGSILSGVTCAGAFAAFMSTFSGLLVSMTGALAHDVYGRMLRPNSTPEQRMRMFKIAAVIIGGVAMLLGSFVEPLEINFMVGQAFAIAAASYFPLLFMSVWWRSMTMRGAAVGMLTGGLCALIAATLTNVSNLALDKGPMGKIFASFASLNDYWAHHPLLRILCEQPAIWTVPLAITLMIVVSKATRKEVPSDVRMKMLVLHAPEKLGLKQEYIQEHQGGGH
jgi:Na+(H+)/acetate symporter ActP